jgi:predicted HAD superfamily Cof-like phosphohydrolase
MRVVQEKVRQFHQKYGYANPDKPALISKEAAEARMDLIHEELEEYYQAVQNGDLVAIADALADLTYVVVGTAVVHGMDLQPLLDEVHRSNMTKDPAADNPQKPVKGSRFEHPRLAELLMIQSTGLAEVV